MVTKEQIDLFKEGVVMEFDGSNAVKPEGDFKKIETGWYKVIATNLEKKISKSGVYHMVKVEYKIQNQGEFKKRLLADHFCIAINDAGMITDKSKSEMALQIGRYNFTEFLVLTTGKKTINLEDLDSLIGSKVSVYVDSKEEDKYVSIKEKAAFDFEPTVNQVVNHAPTNFQAEPTFEDCEDIPF